MHALLQVKKMLSKVIEYLAGQRDAREHPRLQALHPRPPPYENIAAGVPFTSRRVRDGHGDLEIPPAHTTQAQACPAGGGQEIPSAPPEWFFQASDQPPESSHKDAAVSAGASQLPEPKQEKSKMA